MFQTITIEQCTACVCGCVKQLLRLASSLFFFFYLPPSCPGHKPDLDLGHERAARTYPLKWHKDCCGCFIISWVLECAVISESGGFGAGNRGGKLGSITALIEVIISGMTDSHGCVRQKKAMPGFWDWRCECSGKLIMFPLLSMGSFNLDSLCW